MNYKYRMHDPRTGRFFSTDPLEHEYPHNSPYAFSENMVIHAIELEGLEAVDYNNTVIIDAPNKSLQFYKNDKNKAKNHVVYANVEGRKATFAHMYHGQIQYISFFVNRILPQRFGVGLKHGMVKSYWIKGSSEFLLNYTDSDVLNKITNVTGADAGEISSGFNNTLRHFMWQSLLTLAYDSETAKDFGDAHEDDDIGTANPQYKKDNLIDLLNNAYARTYAGKLDSDEVFSSFENFVEYLNDMTVHILETGDGYKEDDKFDAIRSGEVKLFNTNDKKLKAIYKDFKKQKKSKKIEVKN